MENTTANVIIPESFRKALAANKAVFPTSLDLESFLEYVPGNQEQGYAPSWYLPVGVKRLWFYEYCAAKNVAGRIIPDVSIQFDVAVPGGLIGYALGKTDVYIGENLVASAQAGQSFSLSNPNELDSVIQMVTGLAQSKALSTAGFGVTPSTKLEDIPPQYPMNPAAGPIGGQTVQTGELPFIMENPGAGQNAPVTPTPAPAPVPGANPAEAFQFSPYDRAKAVKWPFEKGDPRRIGKTLGELLAVDPKAIYYLAAEWPGQAPAKDAAKLLLPEACKALGKPVPANT